MKRLFALALCALLLLSCEIISGDDGPGPQQYLFEVEHANAAWARIRIGLYVDNQGRIYHYNLSGIPWKTKSRDHFTEAELWEKYNHKKEQIGTVDRAVLEQMTALIRPASEGALSEPVFRCYDAGVTHFRAYLYDPRGGHYTPVLLQEEGDAAQKNLSASAQTLLTWLKSLDERFDNDYCLPFFKISDSRFLSFSTPVPKF